MASSPAEPSPPSSQGSLPEFTLEALVEHLLASKRSLAAIQHVARAQDIVVAGREALEENTILAAKNGYMNSALTIEVRKLEALRAGMAALEDEVGVEFEATVKSLDSYDVRLKTTLHGLKATGVLQSFRPPDEPQKCLFDFIDESGVNSLYASIKSSIDRFDAARSDFENIRQTFDSNLERIQHGLLLRTDDVVHEMPSHGNVSPVPSFFSSLENHATEVAGHLEGLVKHYDLCVTALKHTEGGSEAIVRVSTSTEEAIALPPETSQLVGLGVDLGTLSHQGPPEPISAGERAEMLAVLAKDASDVEDVVADIKDHLTDMEDQLASIVTYIDALRSNFDQLRAALKLLKDITSSVPECISAAADFQAHWEEERRTLKEKAEEVNNTVSILAGFSSAYDGLIVETQRRRHVKARMERIIDKAMNEIEKLYHEDLNEREAFRKDQAEYLPSDIWPGLLSPPPRYAFSSLDNGAGALPEIRKSDYEAALKRLRARLKPSMRDG